MEIYGTITWTNIDFFIRRSERNGLEFLFKMYKEIKIKCLELNGWHTEAKQNGRLATGWPFC